MDCISGLMVIFYGLWFCLQALCLYFMGCGFVFRPYVCILWVVVLFSGLMVVVYGLWFYFQACHDLMNKCITNMNQRADKQYFLELNNSAFNLPKKFEFQAHKGDEVRKTHGFV